MCYVRIWNESALNFATKCCCRGLIVAHYRGDSPARHLLSPSKQREGPQREQPCSGRTELTAAALPEAVERTKKCSESTVTTEKNQQTFLEKSTINIM